MEAKNRGVCSYFAQVLEAQLIKSLVSSVVCTRCRPLVDGVAVKSCSSTENALKKTKAKQRHSGVHYE